MADTLALWVCITWVYSVCTLQCADINRIFVLKGLRIESVCVPYNVRCQKATE